MANYHGIVNTMSMSCINVDAMNMAGVYATADLDNGTLVTLKNIAKVDETGTITGFEYMVEPAAANATNVWLVATPEVGKTLEMQIHDDIRYFYNEAGKPMSIKGILAGIDCPEVDASAFAGGTLPVVANVGQYCGVAANGKFAAPQANAPAAGAYFRVEGFHSITCGADEVATVVLRCMRNA
nr:MAG TPA_asm: hypothetical protein [Bacteriophage sp.]